MTPSPDSKPNTLSPKALILMALFLIVTWGGAFTLISVGVKYLSPAWLVVYRLIFGGVMITAYMYMRGQRFPKLTDTRWLWYGVLGITGMSLPFFLISTGQLVVDSGLSAIIVGSMPLITIILAHFFVNEKLTLRKLLGFLIGFLGIVVLFLPETISFTLIEDWRSQGLILFAALLYAITTVGAKRAPETSSTIATSIMLVSASLSAVIGAFLIEGFNGAVPNPEALITVILTVAGLGIGSTVTATIVYLYIIEKTGPSVIARVNYFVPAASVAMGIFFLNEPFTLRMVIAFVIILVGIIISRERKPAVISA